MKKYCFIILTIFIFCNCGGGGSSESQIGEIEDISSANQIIEFNNEVVDYMNETSNQIGKTSRFSEDFGRMITQKSDRFQVNNSIAFIGRPTDFKKIIDLAPGVIPDHLKNNIEELDKSYQLVKEKNKMISKYRKNQDFKDDDWKMGAELNASMIAEINKFYETKELISNELRIIGDKAEEKILEDHPLKNPILAAKKDLVLVGDLQVLMFSETLDRAAIQVAYDQLEKSSEQHKEEFNEVLEKMDEKKSYDRFHEKIEDFLGNIRKILRYDRELKTGDFNSISVDYKSIIGGYNSFVN